MAQQLALSDWRSRSSDHDIPPGVRPLEYWLNIKQGGELTPVQEQVTEIELNQGLFRLSAIFRLTGLNLEADLLEALDRCKKNVFRILIPGSGSMHAGVDIFKLLEVEAARRGIRLEIVNMDLNLVPDLIPDNKISDAALNAVFGFEGSVTDMGNIPDGYFDYVIDRGLWKFVDDPLMGLEEIYRVSDRSTARYRSIVTALRDISASPSPTLAFAKTPFVIQPFELGQMIEFDLSEQQRHFLGFPWSLVPEKGMTVSQVTAFPSKAERPLVHRATYTWNPDGRWDRRLAQRLSMAG